MNENLFERILKDLNINFLKSQEILFKMASCYEWMSENEKEQYQAILKYNIDYLNRFVK